LSLILKMIEDDAMPDQPTLNSDSAHRPFRPLWFLFIVLCALVVIMIVSRLTAPREIIPWRTDFAAAQKEAALAHKPVFAYFTAEWCEPCQYLKRTTWADRDVERALRDYVPVKIDIDRHRDLALRYVADPIPKFIVMDAEGTALKSIDHALTPEEFLAWLKW
jgi:thiol:disulfide interchange protein